MKNYVSPIMLMATCLLLSSLNAQDKDYKTIAILKEEKNVQINRLAVINMENVFQEYYKTKVADATLKKQAEAYRAYAEKLTESRTKLQAEFKELRDASLNVALSSSEKESKRLEAQEKYRQLKSKEAEWTQYVREKETKMKDAYAQKRISIINEIQELVKKRSILEGYTLVLDSSGRSSNHIPSIIYTSPSVDITASVLKELNRGHENELDEYKTKEK